MESWFGQMVENMKVIFKITNNMDKANYPVLMGKFIQVSGSMENARNLKYLRMKILLFLFNHQIVKKKFPFENN